jgi:flagellar motor protein MotB
MRFSKTESNYSDEENPYWISFSDIMSGLLVIFILATLVLILDLVETKSQVNAAIEELKKSEEVRRTILHEIVQELRAKNIPVELSDNDTVLRIPSKVLAFVSDEHYIPSDMSEVVTQIGEALYTSITKDERWHYLDTIFVEGHTDNLRSKKLKGGNWGLSGYRAIAMWQHWLDHLPVDQQLKELLNHNEEPLFSVSGYGDTRPITKEQNTPELRERNRRIDIRFTVKRPKIGDLEEIKNAVSFHP